MIYNVHPLEIIPSFLPTKQTDEIAKEVKIAQDAMPKHSPKDRKKFFATLSLSPREILRKIQGLKIRETCSVISQFFKKIAHRVQKTFASARMVIKLNSEIKKRQRTLCELQKIEPTSKRIIDLKAEISELKEKKRKREEDLLILEKLPANFIYTLSGLLTTAWMLGTFTKSIAKNVMTGLRIASGWVGGVAIGVSIPFSFLDLGLGVKKIVYISRALSRNKERYHHLIKKPPEDMKIPEELLKTCHDLQQRRLDIQRLKLTRDWRKAIYQASAGALGIFGGVLGIASLCSGGWAAVGLSIVGGVVAIVGIGVTIASTLQSRSLKKKINEYRTVETKNLTDIAKEIQSCSPEAKRFLATIFEVPYLELDQHPEETLKAAFGNLQPA